MVHVQSTSRTWSIKHFRMGHKNLSMSADWKRRNWTSNDVCDPAKYTRYFVWHTRLVFNSAICVTPSNLLIPDLLSELYQTMCRKRGHWHQRYGEINQEAWSSHQCFPPATQGSSTATLRECGYQYVKHRIYHPIFQIGEVLKSINEAPIFYPLSKIGRLFPTGKDSTPSPCQKVAGISSDVVIAPLCTWAKPTGLIALGPMNTSRISPTKSTQSPFSPDTFWKKTTRPMLESSYILNIISADAWPSKVLRSLNSPLTTPPK